MMALSMIQNAKLPPIVQTSMVIQLSGRIRSDEDRTKSYVMSKKKVDPFIQYICDINNELDPEEELFQH